MSSLRRYRWPLIALSALMLMIGLWAWWAQVAQRRLQARLAAIAARGEPLTPAELQKLLPPATRPTGKYLHQAIAAIDRDVYSPSGSSQVFTSYPPYTREWEQMT